MNRFFLSFGAIGGPSLVLAGTGVRAIGQWILIWLLVRWYGPAEVGNYGLAQAWVVPLVAFFDFQLFRIQTTDVEGQYSFEDYLSFRVWTSGSMWICLLIIASFNSSIAILMLAIAAQLSVAAIAEIYQAKILVAHGVVRYGRSLFLFYSIMSTAMVLTILVSRRVELALFMSALASIVVLFGRVVPDSLAGRAAGELYSSSARWKPIPPNRHLFSLLRICAPLGIAMLFDSAATQIPRLFLASHVGVYELGLLVGMLTLLSVGTLVVDAAARSLTPHVARIVNEGEARQIWTFSKWISGGVLLATIILAILSYWIGSRALVVILDDSYRGQNIALACIACVFGFQLHARICAIVLATKRQTGRILFSHVIATLAAVVISLLVIPKYGLIGAVITILIVNALRWLVGLIMAVIALIGSASAVTKDDFAEI